MQTIIEQHHPKQNDIYIPSGEVMQYTLIIDTDGEYLCRFHIDQRAEFNGSVIITARQAHLTIETIIEGDDVSSNLKILALAKDMSSITVEGISKVEKSYHGVTTRVDQTNILLGKNIHIRGVPVLKVAAHDIQGGHSCKVHRLGGEALFYLESRGLDEKDAEAMLLSGEIQKHLAILDDEIQKESLYKRILESLK